MKGFFSPLTGYVTSACSNFTAKAPEAVSARFARLSIYPGAAVTHPRKPIEIIAESLRCASEDIFEVSEDIIADLEAAGWRFVYLPDADVDERMAA